MRVSVSRSCIQSLNLTRFLVPSSTCGRLDVSWFLFDAEGLFGEETSRFLFDVGVNLADLIRRGFVEFVSDATELEQGRTNILRVLLGGKSGIRALDEISRKCGCLSNTACATFCCISALTLTRFRATSGKYRTSRSIRLYGRPLDDGTVRVTVPC